MMVDGMKSDLFFQISIDMIKLNNLIYNPQLLTINHHLILLHLSLIIGLEGGRKKYDQSTIISHVVIYKYCKKSTPLSFSCLYILFILLVCDSSSIFFLSSFLHKFIRQHPSPHYLSHHLSHHHSIVWGFLPSPWNLPNNQTHFETPCIWYLSQHTTHPPPTPLLDNIMVKWHGRWW